MGAGVEFYNRRKGFEFKATSGPTGVKFENRIGVQAPPAIVWEIIHDLAAWPQWNPIYPETAGVVRIGEVLTLTRAVPEPSMPRTEAAALETSMIRPLMNGPRSLIRTTTALPCWSVTLMS